jgi:hypothetical protein
VTLLEHAEHRLQAGATEQAEPLFAEADRIFEQLRAEPWLRRVRRARAGEAHVRG